VLGNSLAGKSVKRSEITAKDRVGGQIVSSGHASEKQTRIEGLIVLRHFWEKSLSAGVKNSDVRESRIP